MCVAIGAGTAAATLVAPLVKKVLAPKQYEVGCMVGAVIVSCGLLIPQLYVAITAIVSMFVTMGNVESSAIFLGDERIVPEERRLVRSKFYGIGSIIEQTQMVAAILVCSVLIRGDASAAMACYAVRDVSTRDARLAGGQLRTSQCGVRNWASVARCQLAFLQKLRTMEVIVRNWPSARGGGRDGSSRGGRPYPRGRPAPSLSFQPTLGVPSAETEANKREMRQTSRQKGLQSDRKAQMALWPHAARLWSLD